MMQLQLQKPILLLLLLMVLLGEHATGMCLLATVRTPNRCLQQSASLLTCGATSLHAAAAAGLTCWGNAPGK
jgi:hypothetical protein